VIEYLRRKKGGTRILKGPLKNLSHLCPLGAVWRRGPDDIVIKKESGAPCKMFLSNVQARGPPKENWARSTTRSESSRGGKGGGIDGKGGNTPYGFTKK